MTSSIKKKVLMPFGRYTGRPVFDLPRDYLFWLLSKRETIWHKHPALYCAVRKQVYAILRHELDEVKASRLSRAMGASDRRNGTRFRFKVYSVGDLISKNGKLGKAKRWRRLGMPHIHTKRKHSESPS